MVHKYKMGKYMIAVDSCNAAVLSIDEITYDIIDHLTDCVPQEPSKQILDSLAGKYPSEKITEAYKELYDAYQAGLIFSKDLYRQFCDSPLLNSPIKAMCLNICHDCNMACEYCFASKGDFGGAREVMPLETAKKAIDFLIQHSENQKSLEVEFFGGEPLLAFDTVKNTVDYARNLEKKCGKKFKFTITTNGLLLNDEIIDFINKEFSAVVMSLDGRKSINDRMRKSCCQGGTYDYVIPKFKKLVNARADKEYYIRGTFTKYNLDFSQDVMHIYNLGFKNISIEPVVGSEKADYSLGHQEVEKINSEYERLAQMVLDMKRQGKDINFYRFDIDLSKPPCALKRLKGCSCGNEFIAVAPNGDIFPCHQFVGDDKFLMGNINNGTFNNLIKQKFSQINLYKKEECQKCWARLFCGGGCNANNFHYMDNLFSPFKPFCDIEKKRLECAFMLNVALKNQ